LKTNFCTKEKNDFFKKCYIKNKSEFNENNKFEERNYLNGKSKENKNSGFNSYNIEGKLI